MQAEGEAALLEGDEDHNPLDPSSLPALSSPLQIRPYEPADWPAVWALLEPVLRAGETFPHDPAITEAEAQVAWVECSEAVLLLLFLVPTTLLFHGDVADKMERIQLFKNLAIMGGLLLVADQDSRG